MHSSIASIESTGSTLLNKSLVPESARKAADFWQSLFQPLIDAHLAGRALTARLAEISKTTETPYKTVEKKFYNFRKLGFTGILDRRVAGSRYWKTTKRVGLSQADIDLVKQYCDANKRSIRAAVKSLRRDFLAGKVRTETPIDPTTRFPIGWGISNLARYAPSKFERRIQRIGRSAAATERPLTYTTRAGLWIMSHVMLDDMWHDHFVHCPIERKVGRPLELFSHDLFTARKIRWGCRVRTQNDDGSYNGLSERMTRYILAATLYLDGWNPARGTTIVAEHGTAAVREEIERRLAELGGKDEHGKYRLRVARSGMEGSAPHAGQYPGIARGNFRFKASLESSNNLTHNAFAALPAQAGPSVDRRPEELSALLKHSEQLLEASQFLPPDLAAKLELPTLSMPEFMQIAQAIYHHIETDADHALEGWEMCGHVAKEILIADSWISERKLLADPVQAQFALALIAAGNCQGRARRMSRLEAYLAHQHELTPIPGYGVVAILGDDLGVERKTRSNMFEFEDREVGFGVHRYDTACVGPHGERFRLSDRETYRVFINPFAPETLFAQDARGSFLGQCDRIIVPCRADHEAVVRAIGHAAETEAELLAPLRHRALSEARKRAARHRNNSEVLATAVARDESLTARAERALDTALSQPQSQENEPATNTNYDHTCTHVGTAADSYFER